MWNYETINSATGGSIFFNAIFFAVMFFCSAYLSDEYHLVGWTSLILTVLVFVSGVGLINYLCLREPVHCVAQYKDKKTKRRINQFFSVPIQQAACF